MADNNLMTLRFKQGFDKPFAAEELDGTLYFAKKGYAEAIYLTASHFEADTETKYILNSNGKYEPASDVFDANQTYYKESTEGYLYGKFNDKYYSITSKFLDDAIFNHNVRIKGDLEVKKDVKFEENLTVDGDTLLSSTVVGESFKAYQTSEFFNTVTIGTENDNSDLIVFGNVSLIGQNKTIIGDPNKDRDNNLESTFDRKLLIYNDTQFGGGETDEDIQITIDAYTNDITIKNKNLIDLYTPNISINGLNKDEQGKLIPTEISVIGNVNQDGDFSLTGSAFIDDTLHVQSDTFLYDDLTVYQNTSLVGPKITIGDPYIDNNNDKLDDNLNELQIYGNIQIGNDAFDNETKTWLNRTDFSAYTETIFVDNNDNITLLSKDLDIFVPTIQITGGTEINEKGEEIILSSKIDMVSNIDNTGYIHLNGKMLLGNDGILEEALRNDTLDERLYVLGEVTIGDKTGSSDYNAIPDNFNIYNKVQIGDYITNTNYHDRTLKVYGPVTIGHEKRPQSLNLYGTTTLTGTTNLIGTTNLTGNVVIGLPISSGKSSATHSDTNTVYSLNIHNNTIIGSYTDGNNYEDRNLTVHGATVIGHASRKKDLTVNGDVHITGSDLYLGSGTTAATRVQMTYSGTNSGDTLTITFND